jgi:hypothetical protein
MKTQSISEWKKEVAERWETHSAYIVNKNSYADWGNASTRRFLAREVSPRGGVYHVYARTTIAREKELAGK